MKKMMMITAVVLTTAFVQAASVSWTVTNVRIPTQTALKIGASNAKFTYPQTADLVMKLYVVPASGDTVDLGKVAALTADATVASSVLWDQSTAVSMRSTYGVAGATTEKNVTLRLVSTYTTTEGTYTLNTDVINDLQSIESVGIQYKFNMAGQTWSFVAVPEPTSMALLLMGVAALALKRRVR